jgi:hypothetical protein
MRKSISRIFSICLVVLVLAGCSGVPYSNREKLAMGVFCTTAFADGHTSIQAFNRGAREGYPGMPDKPNDGQIALLQFIKFTVLWTCGEIWPDKRETVWYTGAMFSGGYAVHNSRAKKK